MPRHLRALIPGKRLAKMLRKFGVAAGNGIADRLGAMSGERGAVLATLVRSMPGHGRQMKKQGEARASLDQRADCRVVQAKDQIPFPMAGNSAIRRVGRTFADHDLG